MRTSLPAVILRPRRLSGSGSTSLRATGGGAAAPGLGAAAAAIDAPGRLEHGLAALRLEIHRVEAAELRVFVAREVELRAVGREIGGAVHDLAAVGREQLLGLPAPFHQVEVEVGVGERLVEDE